MKTFTTILCFCLIILGCYFLPTQNKSDSKEIKTASDIKLNAEELLKQVDSKYKSFLTYVCDGNIKHYYNDDEKIYTTNFNLQYYNPKKLKIYWEEESVNKIFTVNQNHSYLEINGELQERSDDPLRLFTIISMEGSKSRFEVGEILLSNDFNNSYRFPTLKSPKITGKEIVDGNSCYIVESQVNTGYDMKLTYWIDTESLLIRRYESFLTMGKGNEQFYKSVETYSNIQAQ